MAFSLFGERSVMAAISEHPLDAFMRRIARVQAARKRRAALSALLELDHAGLDDLGISHGDVVAAMTRPNQAGRLLHTARARKACA